MGRGIGHWGQRDMGSAVWGREGRILLCQVVLPEHWTRLPFPFDPGVWWGTCFQKCFPLGRELGLVKHRHWILDGSSGSRGRQMRRQGGLHRQQDGGDRGLRLRRKRLTQELFPTRIGGDIRGHLWYSGSGCGITMGVEVGGARGMSSGRSVPGINVLVEAGVLPTLNTGGVLDLDFCLLTVVGRPTNG